MKPLKERTRLAAEILGCTVEELEASLKRAEQRAEGLPPNELVGAVRHMLAVSGRISRSGPIPLLDDLRSAEERVTKLLPSGPQEKP